MQWLVCITQAILIQLAMQWLVSITVGNAMIGLYHASNTDIYTLIVILYIFLIHTKRRNKLNFPFIKAQESCIRFFPCVLNHLFNSFTKNILWIVLESKPEFLNYCWWENVNLKLNSNLEVASRFSVFHGFSELSDTDNRNSYLFQ